MVSISNLVRYHARSFFMIFAMLKPDFFINIPYCAMPAARLPHTPLAIQRRAAAMLWPGAAFGAVPRARGAAAAGHIPCPGARGVVAAGH